MQHLMLFLPPKRLDRCYMSAMLATVVKILLTNCVCDSLMCVSVWGWDRWGAVQPTGWPPSVGCLVTGTLINVVVASSG